MSSDVLYVKDKAIDLGSKDDFVVFLITDDTQLTDSVTQSLHNVTGNQTKFVQQADGSYLLMSSQGDVDTNVLMHRGFLKDSRAMSMAFDSGGSIKELWLNDELETDMRKELTDSMRLAYAVMLKASDVFGDKGNAEVVDGSQRALFYNNTDLIGASYIASACDVDYVFIDGSAFAEREQFVKDLGYLIGLAYDYKNILNTDTVNSDGVYPFYRNKRFVVVCNESERAEILGLCNRGQRYVSHRSVNI